MDLELSAIGTLVEKSIGSDKEDAYSFLNEAYKQYIDIRKYAEAVLRESKCEALNLAFLEALNSPDENHTKSGLIIILEGIRETEKMSFSSLF